MEDSVKAYRMSAQEFVAPVADGAMLHGAGEQSVAAISAKPIGVSGGDVLRHIDRTLLRPKNYELVKRLHDVIFSLGFMLVCGVWLFPIIALAIKLDSRGPVFFKQERVGWKGRKFSCLKFRTMSHNPGACFIQAQKDDPRVTRAGKFLRKTNLDELPQFINVLKGEMSVVGPRPHVYALDELHCEEVAGYKLRTLVRPGVTGLAQVSGCRGETRSVRDMQHRIRFDLFYLRNMSLMLDIKIIALTVLRLLQGDNNAY